MRPVHFLLAALAIAIALVAGSRPGAVGDGGEYLAQALNFTSFHGPAIDAEQIPSLQRQVAAIDRQLESWRIEGATVESHAGGRDFVHFWFYALLATPAMWLVQAVGAPPTAAFTLTNIAVLGLAVWILIPRIGPAATLLLMAGPIIWWIDKAHTEAFTFGLLAIALALFDERPWWSIVAAGAAATQNPPIVAMVGLLVVVAAARRPELLRNRRFQFGIAAGVALALLHPVYTYWRHGTSSLLLSTTRNGMPPLVEIAAVVVDSNMGLIGNYPLFLVVVATAMVVIARRNWRTLLSGSFIVAGLTAVAFLYSFAQAANQHNAGTPSLSRYAVWLIPLAIPLLAHLHRVAGRGWQRFVLANAVVSAVVSVFAFHPSVPENSREPTWLATFLWTHVPGWSNPLPEVFMETTLRTEQPWVPVVAGACDKILIAGRATEENVWPKPCYPAVIPEECRTRGALCYANRTQSGYDFVPAPGRLSPVAPLRREWVWPTDTVPFVRQFYEDWNWSELEIDPEDLDVLRQAHAVRATPVGRPDRFFVILSDVRAGAFLRFRPSVPLTGALLDPGTGGVLQNLRVDPRDDGEAVVVPLPEGADLLFLTLQAE